jgi:DNA-directed RNA polymerase subunit omega
MSFDKKQARFHSDPPFFPKISARSSQSDCIMTAQLIEEASKKIPVPQVLVNVVSRRVRQLSAGHRPLIETTPRMGFSDIALTEIIQGKLTYEDAPPEVKPVQP